jgi:hypothetical protein
MVVTCKTYGQHFGGSETVGTGIGPHSDHSCPIPELIAQLEDGDAPAAQYQVAHYRVDGLDQCTQTLYVFNLETNAHEELTIAHYVAWLRWLEGHRDVDELNEMLQLGGKQEWPQWTLDSFEDFRLADGPAWQTARRIVLRTPPNDLHPGFSGGWVTMRWLQGSLHAGFKVRKRRRGDPHRFRTVIFYTEPDISGHFISDKPKKVKPKKLKEGERPKPPVWPTGPSFQEQYDQLRWEVDAVVRSEPSVEDVRAQLEVRTPEWTRRYRLTCMDGPSHTNFLRRVVLVVTSQPTREQMLATLWHTGRLDMDLGQDPRELVVRRQRLIERAEGYMGRIRYTTVSSTDAHESTVMGRVLQATHQLQMTRLHHYLSVTSGLDFQPADNFATLYAPQRKQFRKGPHRGDGNISDSCWRCTEAGFGIFGAIFVFPHDIIQQVLDEEQGAGGEL